MGINENVSLTLTASCGSFAQYTEEVTVGPKDKVEVIALESHPQDSRIGFSKDGKIQTLARQMGAGGGNVPLLMEVYSDSFHTDTAHTLAAMDRHAVIYKDKVGTLCASDSRGANNTYVEQNKLIAETYSLDYAAYNQGKNAQYKPEISNSGIAPTAVAKGPSLIAEPKTQYAVRRLTPRECERLQGFPDGWTDTGSDTARYKALGNSVAVPCVEFIMEGIKNNLKE